MRAIVILQLLNRWLKQEDRSSGKSPNRSVTALICRIGDDLNEGRDADAIAN
ncbi:MAG: hypothetical protein AAFR58_12400 [Cyanobacteria bacterium J06627_28]